MEAVDPSEKTAVIAAFFTSPAIHLPGGFLSTSE